MTLGDVFITALYLRPGELSEFTGLGYLKGEWRMGEHAEVATITEEHWVSMVFLTGSGLMVLIGEHWASSL